MAWDRNAPTNPKYRSAEHRAERKRLEREMRARGYLWCAQPECVMGSRIIKPGEQWCAGHDDSGTRYIGAVHKACNDRDAVVRAHERRAALKRSGWVI